MKKLLALFLLVSTISVSANFSSFECYGTDGMASMVIIGESKSIYVSGVQNVREGEYGIYDFVSYRSLHGFLFMARETRSVGLRVETSAVIRETLQGEEKMQVEFLSDVSGNEIVAMARLEVKSKGSIVLKQNLYCAKFDD